MARVKSLISPSPVVIEQVDKSATLYDQDAREPIRQVARGPQVQLSAQISWGRSARVGWTRGGQGGAQEEASGYLVFLQREVLAKGITLGRGDRVVKIAGKARTVYLTNQQDAGHHGGESELLFWDFLDKRPTS